MNRTFVVAALVAMWCGACAPPDADPPPEDDATGRRSESRLTDTSELRLADLAGRWSVLSIAGEEPATPPGREAWLGIDAQRIGGSIGCNSFGALALVVDGMLATHHWVGTAIGCSPPLGDQELALGRILGSRPRIARTGPDSLGIVAGEGRIELAYLGPYDEPPIAAGSPPLTGTTWRIVLLDGSEQAVDPATRYLRFDAGTWQGLASCATLSGSREEAGDRIRVGEQVATTEQNCRADHAALDTAFAQLMRSNPRYLVGPNGELLIAGGGHVLVGGRAE